MKQFTPGFWTKFIKHQPEGVRGDNIFFVFSEVFESEVLLAVDAQEFLIRLKRKLFSWMLALVKPYTRAV